MRNSAVSLANSRGTSVAIPDDMAAVMALIFLFALASVALMLKISAVGLTLGTGLAMACFVALASGVFVGAMIQARHWEEEA